MLLWPTDLPLLGLSVRLLRGRFYAGRLLRGYAHLPDVPRAGGIGRGGPVYALVTK